jgi:carbon starvation protein CstA
LQYEKAEGTFKTKEATEVNKNKYVAVRLSCLTYMILHMHHGRKACATWTCVWPVYGCGCQKARMVALMTDWRVLWVCADPDHSPARQCRHPHGAVLGTSHGYMFLD